MYDAVLMLLMPAVAKTIGFANDVDKVIVAKLEAASHSHHGDTWVSRSTQATI